MSQIAKTPGGRGGFRTWDMAESTRAGPRAWDSIAGRGGRGPGDPRHTQRAFLSGIRARDTGWSVPPLPKSSEPRPSAGVSVAESPSCQIVAPMAKPPLAQAPALAAIRPAPAVRSAASEVTLWPRQAMYGTAGPGVYSCRLEDNNPGGNCVAEYPQGIRTEGEPHESQDEQGQRRSS
jgi:hypothetical protein